MTRVNNSSDRDLRWNMTVWTQPVGWRTGGYDAHGRPVPELIDTPAAGTATACRELISAVGLTRGSQSGRGDAPRNQGLAGHFKGIIDERSMGIGMRLDRNC